MKRLVALFGLVCLGFAAPGLGAEWLTDARAAQQIARRDNKCVLLDFTGSDWCPWCMKLKAEVFDQPEFAAFAQGNLELVEVDFPRGKAQSPAQRSANEELARTYGIHGYPTVIVLNSTGQKIGQAGYMPGGPKAFIERLQRMPGLEHATAASGAREPEAEAAKKPVEFVPIAPAAPTHYGELALKALSGAGNRRMALINNETFMAGETANVRVHDGHVEVCCKEIRPNSVLVTVDGKPMELRLAVH